MDDKVDPRELGKILDLWEKELGDGVAYWDKVMELD
jgi:hypothetical protein